MHPYLKLRFADIDLDNYFIHLTCGDGSHAIQIICYEGWIPGVFVLVSMLMVVFGD